MGKQVKRLLTDDDNEFSEQLDVVNNALDGIELAVIDLFSFRADLADNAASSDRHTTTAILATPHDTMAMQLTHFDRQSSGCYLSVPVFRVLRQSCRFAGTSTRSANVRMP